MIEKWRMRWLEERLKKLTWERCLGSTRQELREFKRWPTGDLGWWCWWSRRTSKALTRNCGSWSFSSRVGSSLGVLVLLILMGVVRTLLLCLLLPISLRRGAVVALTLTICLWVVRVPKSSYLRSPQASPQFLDPIKPAIWSELLSPVKCWTPIH